MIGNGDIHIVVVVDPVAAVSTHHQQGRRLLPPPVAAGLVARGQGLDQPLGQGAFGLPETLGHGPQYLLSLEGIALDSVVGPGHASGPVKTAGPGEVGGPALGIDHAHLAAVPVWIIAGEDGHRLLGSGAVFQQGEAAAGEGGVTKGLGGHRPHPHFGKGDHRPDVGKLGLHGNPQIAVVGVEGDDRIGHDRLLGRWEVGLQS